MTISRWKMMAGVIGVAIGGLAAITGQTSKPEAVRALRAEEKPVVKEEPKPPSVVSSPLIRPVPTPSEVSAPPTSAILPVLPATPPTAFAAPALGPVAIELPTLPEVKPTVPVKPVDLPVPSGFRVFDPEVPLTKPTPSAPLIPAFDPSPAPKPSAPSQPPISITPVEPTIPIVDVVPPTKAVAVAAVQTKFRIVLRVGETEPTFEVRHNDDLVMKVACDKVDIKSPEKGHGLSNIIATGKVRFVGFGAEGTCDSLSFLAGSGEVALAGNVNVKVRDKIGRVESELNADKMQYKLDQTALTGVLKP